MEDDSQISGVITEPDGSFTAAYGPFALRSAFQPIFSQSTQGYLKLEAYEALIRPTKSDEPVSPAQFFSMVEPGDGANVERLCRRLHILNASASNTGEALLFLNFDPRFFTDSTDVLREAECLAKLAQKAGLSVSQIVCEIIEKQASSRHLLSLLCDGLRERKFKIAVDDYGADDSDIERLETLRPDIVKFDALWVHRFMETNEGLALLGVMVKQFRDRGILTLFEGLEEHWQVSTCRELGVRLLQGFALGKPKLAPMIKAASEPSDNALPQDAEAQADADAFRPVEVFAGRPAATPSLAHAPRRMAFGRRGT